MSLNQLSAEDQLHANQLYGHLTGLQDQFSGNVGRQQALDTQYDKTISGNAPSVAQRQLYAALDQIQRGQQSQVAGASGANAALARQNSMQNTSQAQTEANAQAAQLRAEEIARAQAAKAQNLGIIGQEVGNMYGQNVSGSNAAAGVAMGGAQTQAQIDQQNRMAWMNFVSNLINAGGTAGVTYATSGAK